MKTLHRRLDIKDVTDTGAFVGYGNVYGMVDQADDIVQAGCFADSLAGWKAKGQMPAMLWQHDSTQPIGAYTSMEEDDTGLLVEGKLALKTQRGMEAHELLRMGAISGLSIGFMCQVDQYDKQTGIRTIVKGDLWEVSLVTFPCNQASRVTGVKSIDDLSDLKGIEAYLRDAGLSRTEAKGLISRIKSLSLREADADTEAVLSALNRRQQLLAGTH